MSFEQSNKFTKFINSENELIIGLNELTNLNSDLYLDQEVRKEIKRDKFSVIPCDKIIKNVFEISKHFCVDYFINIYPVYDGRIDCEICDLETKNQVVCLTFSEDSIVIYNSKYYLTNFIDNVDDSSYSKNIEQIRDLIAFDVDEMKVE